MVPGTMASNQTSQMNPSIANNQPVKEAKCPNCSFQTAHRGSLYRHMKTQHKRFEIKAGAAAPNQPPQPPGYQPPQPQGYQPPLPPGYKSDSADSSSMGGWQPATTVNSN